MIATAFDEENAVLERPDNMTDEQCEPLSVRVGQYQDGLPYIISCWKPTKEELAEIIRTGRVWLTVVNTLMPPVALDGISPFRESAG